MSERRSIWSGPGWMQRWAERLRSSSSKPTDRTNDPHSNRDPEMLLTAQAPTQRRFDFARRGPAPSADSDRSPLTPLTPLTPAAPATGWVRREEAIMGTAISVELWAEEARIGAAAVAAVMGEMHRIDRRMSPYKLDSELSRINRDAFERPVPLSEEMFRLLGRAQEFSALSAGTFDITYAAVGRLYDYRAGVRPTDVEVQTARAAVGWKRLHLDARARTVRFGKRGMCIDLGGFAKGYAVDNAITLLRQLGIRHAYVAAGGDSRVLGDRRGRPWTVAIRDPRRPGKVVAVLPLEDTAISTSGDYERYFDEHVVGGEVTRHHHLIDPASGRSPQGVTSVTILAPDGITAEGLSKAVFVLGPAAGLELLETIPGVDGVIIDSEGRLHATPGLMDVGQASARQGENA